MDEGPDGPQKFKLQVYLDARQERDLRLRSEIEARPMAEMVREALAAYLAPGVGRAVPSDDPFWTLIGSVRGSPGEDGSVEPDHHVYGTPKRGPRIP